MQGAGWGGGGWGGDPEPLSGTVRGGMGPSGSSLMLEFRECRAEAAVSFPAALDLAVVLDSQMSLDDGSSAWGSLR